MIFLMAIIPYLPLARVDEAILDLLRQALPASAADMFAGVVSDITREKRGGLLSVALAGALWAASTGMHAVMQQLNVAFDVVERRSFLRARAVALVLTVLYGALVLTAFSLVVLGGVIQDWIGERYGYTSALLNVFIVFRWVVIALALLLALAGVYHAAPNRDRPFALVTMGTLTAAVLFIAAALGFKFYAANFADYDATYGSIGAVIVLMLWLYIAGLALLIGAEIDALRARGRERGPDLTAAEKAKHIG